MNYSKLYKTLFESISTDDDSSPNINYDSKSQTSLLICIIESMHSTIMTKSEDVIQSVDVLEYLTQILSDIK